MAPRREPYDRLETIRRIAANIHNAIRREPLLRRLPPQQELAEQFRASLRDVRAALDTLIEQGVIQAGRGGYVVLVDSEPGFSLPPVQAIAVCYRDHNRYTSPFYQNIIKGIDDACRQRRLSLTLHSFENFRPTLQLVDLVGQYSGPHVGWCFLSIVPQDEVAAAFRTPGRRALAIDPIAVAPGIPSIDLDHIGATRLAIEHLIGLGHRRFGFAARDSGMGSGTEAMRHVRRILAGHDLDLLPDWRLAFKNAYEPDQFEIVRQVARQWQDAANRPTAILTHSIAIGLEVLSLFEGLGVRTPQDLSVVAIGAAYQWPGRTRPMTHAVAGDAAEMGREAVRLIVEQNPLHAVCPMHRMTATLANPRETAAPVAPSPGGERCAR